jgi:hypothetical protein
MVLQNELAELEEVRNLKRVYTELAVFFDEVVVKNQKYKLPPEPPPPPPPPPVGENGPPAPPQQVTFEEYALQLVDERKKYEAREAELVELVSGCINTRTQVCGLPSSQAPDPWMSLSGPCRGYETRSTREYDYCSYWDVDVSPDAADWELKIELLKAGPVCKSEAGRLLSCSSNSSRTQRAGVWEIMYWLREDRSFCSSQFFRSRFTPTESTAEGCREELLHRNNTCYLTCDTCASTCTSPIARTLVNVVRCTFGLPVVGINAAVRASDAGVEMLYRHGAVRTKERRPRPEGMYPEVHNVLINNDITYPRVPYNAISCRKPHHESTFGRYVPNLDEDGNPTKREGFHVGCLTDADCHSKCGQHPIHGMSFVCTKNIDFYSYTSSDNWQSHWIVDPGADEFNVQNTNLTAEWLGTCTDIRYDYQHEGCAQAGASAPVMGIVGCSAVWQGWSLWFCGAQVERTQPDFRDATIPLSGLGYPRTLVPANTINGLQQPEISCGEPLVCRHMCRNMAKSARPGKLGQPLGCAVCERTLAENQTTQSATMCHTHATHSCTTALCPNDVITVITDAVDALRTDIYTTLRLFLTCFGPGGPVACVCNIMMLMKPAWINNLPTEEMKCKAGDVFGLIVDQITELILEWASWVANKLAEIIEPVLCGLTWGGYCDIPDFCWSLQKNVYGRCSAGTGQDALNFLLGCSYRNNFVPASKRCFFERQRQVCLSGDSGKYTRYQKLFTAPTKNELEDEFKQIVGDTFEVRHNALPLPKNGPDSPRQTARRPSRLRSSRRSTSCRKRAPTTCSRTRPRICATAVSSIRCLLTRCEPQLASRSRSQGPLVHRV